MKKHLKKWGVPSMFIVILCTLITSFNAQAQGPDSANMKSIGQVQAYYWAGGESTGLWISANGYLFEDRKTGDKWVKILHNGERRGRVVANKDYTGKGISRRLICKYMAQCDNGITYYMNI